MGLLIAASSGEVVVLATAVAAAIAAAVSAGIAAWQGLLMKRSERNRTQPIVVVYERAEPMHDGDDLVFAVSLANEGAGPAFNVRFGIGLNGLKRTYAPRPAGPHGAGDVPRALGPGRTLPDSGGTYRLRIPAAAGGMTADLNSRVYWCRYENAFGDSWETQNAWQPDEELHIRALRE